MNEQVERLIRLLLAAGGLRRDREVEVLRTLQMAIGVNGRYLAGEAT